MSIEDILNNMKQKYPKVADKKYGLGISSRGVGSTSSGIPEAFEQAVAQPKKPETWTIDGSTSYSADLNVLYPKYAEGIRNGTILINRKFRWLMELWQDDRRLTDAAFVKVSCRPQLPLEEEEINFLGNKTWIPGKMAWEEIGFNIYDSQDRIDFPAFNRVKLGMMDGCGNILENWDLTGCKLALFKEQVDYESSFHYEFRVSYAHVKYVNKCRDWPPCVGGVTPTIPAPQQNQVTIE